MDLLTVDETARLLKVNRITVRRFIASGRLPAVRVGRRVRIRADAVEAVLAPVAPRLDPGAAGLVHSLFPSPSPAEIARRRSAVDRALEVRLRTPSIAPLTTADLVQMARSESSPDEPHA